MSHERKLIEMPQGLTGEQIAFATFESMQKQWRDSLLFRPAIESCLLTAAGFKTMNNFVTAVAPETTVVFIHGGSGTRWTDSLKKPKNQALVSKTGASETMPRALTPIANYIPGIDQETVPIACYNLFAGQRVAGNLVAIHAPGQLENLKDKAFKPLGLDDKTIFVEQKPNPITNKPQGHADALRQAIFDYPKAGKAIRDSKYIVTLFGGIPSRRSTIELSLLAQYVADKYNLPINWITPTTVLDQPRYPINVDDNGIPKSLGHQKLLGDKSIKNGMEKPPNNVGIHIFKTAAILPFLQTIDSLRSIGYQRLFGTPEFALDHIMEEMMKNHALRIFNIADKAELIHDVKAIDVIPEYEKDIKHLLEIDKII